MVTTIRGPADGLTCFVPFGIWLSIYIFIRIRQQPEFSQCYSSFRKPKRSVHSLNQQGPKLFLFCQKLSETLNKFPIFNYTMMRVSTLRSFPIVLILCLWLGCLTPLLFSLFVLHHKRTIQGSNPRLVRSNQRIGRHHPQMILNVLGFFLAWINEE